MAYSSYTVFDGDMYPYYDVSFFTGLFTVFFTIFLFYPEMGICDIPKVNKGFGIALFIINIFLPGKVFAVFVRVRYWYYCWWTCQRGRL